MKDLISERTRVQIFGREYDMDPGGLTPLEVQSLANFVDERMREISDRSNIVDTQKIAVLAAINIALDYLQLKESRGAKDDQLSPMMENLSHVLDEALKS